MVVIWTTFQIKYEHHSCNKHLFIFFSHDLPDHKTIRQKNIYILSGIFQTKGLKSWFLKIYEPKQRFLPNSLDDFRFNWIRIVSAWSDQHYLLFTQELNSDNFTLITVIFLKFWYLYAGYRTDQSKTFHTFRPRRS